MCSVKDTYDIISLGDLNSRPGLKQDYLSAEDNSCIPEFSRLCGTDTTAARPRATMDCNTNSYGDKLIDLCKSIPLRICNGRKLGDISGSYTCYKQNGQSTVDFCLASPSIYHIISTFVINELFPDLSDHCSITVRVKSNYFAQFSNHTTLKLLEKPKRIKWDNAIALSFERNIQSEYSKQFLSEFSSNKLTGQTSIDQAVLDLSDFLVSAADSQGHSFPSYSKAKRPIPNWKFKPRAKRLNYPKWHDRSCEEHRRQLRITSKILQKNPQNPYIRGKLISESKVYNRLRKQKQKEYINNLFLELDQLHQSNPKGYMNIVNSIRDGSFDKAVKDDTDNVSPDLWRDHFQRLLGPAVAMDQKNTDLKSFINSNCDKFTSELDCPFSLTELTVAVKSLKNNKSLSFDQITNEMLKVAFPVIGKQLLCIFNSVLLTCTVPSSWKDTILTPIHKSGPHDDPNNYRGIAVSSCVYKLFSKLLNSRLYQKANFECMVSEQQGSGKKGSRTADHLLVFKFLIDKYVNTGAKLFTCFIDLKKCFDKIPRLLLFSTLLKDYSIGGNFLKLLMEIYSKNRLFIKVSGGLCTSFETTTGVLQGDSNSPLLFNIFVDKITKIFDASCDPVSINNIPQNCLLWADDLLVFSTSAEGLQNSIDKIGIFYSSLGLEISFSKTKIMVFNKSGKLLKGYKFLLNGIELEITNEYQYLGIKFTPSGSMTLATDELCAKARRTWFSISNLLYTNKRMPIARAVKLFDSLVTPVALYASEFWLPCIMQKKCFTTEQNLLQFWETFRAETINQSMCRMLLSVHSKSSRLAVLGDLGRQPLYVPALQSCLSYRQCLALKPSNSLVGLAMAEMADMAGQGKDCWLSRVQNIERLVKLPINSSGLNSKTVGRHIRAKFSSFWLQQINAEKPGPDGFDHNKLRTYKKFKGVFDIEPFYSFVRNRSQRADLSRFRISAHCLGVERLRYSRPPVPLAQRGCRFCGPLGPRIAIGSPGRGPVDDELHAITACSLMAAERFVLYQKMSNIYPRFGDLNCQQKFVRLMCPVSAAECKLINRFIGKTFEKRKFLEEN